MKYSLMLLVLFAAMGANLLGFFWTWNPRADYEEKRMVHVTDCVDYVYYPSSPGQFEKGPNGVDCSRFKPYWTAEPRGYEGVLAALAKNPQWWIFVGFLLAFLTAVGIRAYQFSRPRRKPRSGLPPEPEDYDDPEQLKRYLADLRKFFHLD